MPDISVTPADVQEMGGFCRTTAGQIGSLIGQVNNRILNVDWNSPAKRRFDGTWAEHQRNLLALQEALSELGGAATQMGTNYQSADDAYRG